MSINYTTSAAKNFITGTAQIEKIYYGDIVVWENFNYGVITDSTSHGGLATMYIITPSSKTLVSGYSSGGVTLWNAHPNQFTDILNKTANKVGVFSGTRSGAQTINSPDTNREVTYYYTGFTDEGSTNIGGFYVMYGGSWYTLRQAIENKYIKPLVPFYFINSGDKDGSSGTYVSVDAWFNGGSYKGHRYIHQFGLIIQANKGVQAVQASMGYWESSSGQYWYTENGRIVKTI